jgi:DNA modification methylase
MKTSHRIHFRTARHMGNIASESVALVVTSPPYPMIEMWDLLFAEQNLAIRQALKRRDGRSAFELMHRELDPVWYEVHRILIPGGLACINIGDAARSIGDAFMLYPNHVRILSFLLEAGFTALPLILWRKQTNAPNKFMGSGMYPAGAYVTLEHEYILVVRKGGKREFSSAGEKQRRRESAVFWEERNNWYSDVWMELKGTRQKLQKGGLRSRSGAFPFELAYRLINMFSVKGDTVVDPFLGTGTTLKAAAAAGRHSVGYEIDDAFKPDIFSAIHDQVGIANQRIRSRLATHLEFVQKRREKGQEIKYMNRYHGFPVVTRQETELRLNPLRRIVQSDHNAFEVIYSENRQGLFDCKPSVSNAKGPQPDDQLTLF